MVPLNVGLCLSWVAEFSGLSVSGYGSYRVLIFFFFYCLSFGSKVDFWVYKYFFFLDKVCKDLFLVCLLLLRFSGCFLVFCW